MKSFSRSFQQNNNSLLWESSQAIFISWPLLLFNFDLINRTIMTDEEIQETLDAIEATRIKANKSPEAAREFLIRSGIMKMLEEYEAEVYGRRDETGLSSPY